MTSSQKEHLAWLQAAIESFVRESPANRHPHDGRPIFDAPLVRVADGDDPLWEGYRRIIGPYHLTPREFIGHAAAEQGRPPDLNSERLSVVSWILPIAAFTRETNRAETAGPSQHWAQTRWNGEQFNAALRRHVEGLLREGGSLAIAPVSSSHWKEYWTERPDSPTSNWSERHAAYVAGHGTFSINDGFITERGIAHRCGSVVTDLPLPVSPRPYASHVENCLFFRTGGCLKCADRCPAGAISERGHDKIRCRQYIKETLKPWLDRYQVGIAGCGLCQTNVPCEDCIP